MRYFLMAFLLTCSICSPAESVESTSEEGPFPSQPIQILVYTSPGGLIDLTARRFADIAQRYADVPFVVVNRPGGGGVVAFEEALRRPADGHTLLAVTRSNVSKMVSISREDLLSNLDWLAYVMDNAHVLIARDPDYDVFTAEPQLWLGADIGGVKHVSAIKMAEAAGIEMRWVPFGSGGQAVAALLGNLGDIYVGNPRDALASDELHIVSVAAASRLQSFPQAPTFSELGVEGLANELIWRGFATRQDISEPKRAWLQNLIKQVTNDADWQHMWRNDGVNLDYRDDAAFQHVITQDIAEFRHYIGAAGLIHESDALTTQHWPWVLALISVLACGAILLSKRYFRQRGSQAIIIVILAIMTFALFLLSGIPAASLIDPIGPRGAPLLWVCLLILCAIGLVPMTSRYGELIPAAAGRFMLNKFILLVVLYVVSLPMLGYYHASLIFAPLLLLSLQVRSLFTLILLPILWLLFSWLVFEYMLGIVLPQGMFHS